MHDRRDSNSRQDGQLRFIGRLEVLLAYVEPDADDRAAVFVWLLVPGDHQPGFAPNLLMASRS